MRIDALSKIQHMWFLEQSCHCMLLLASFHLELQLAWRWITPITSKFNYWFFPKLYFPPFYPPHPLREIYCLLSGHGKSPATRWVNNFLLLKSLINRSKHWSSIYSSWRFCSKATTGRAINNLDVRVRRNAPRDFFSFDLYCLIFNVSSDLSLVKSGVGESSSKLTKTISQKVQQALAYYVLQYKARYCFDELLLGKGIYDTGQ